MTSADIKAEIVLCLKAGPGGWSQVQESLSPPSKWLVSAARGKRDEGEIALAFKTKYPDGLELGWPDMGRFVREAVWVLRAQQFGKRDWKEGQDRDLADAFPAAELLIPDDLDVAAWKKRWTEAGGQIFSERCIALKKSDAWSRVSDFGQPYEPFEWATRISRTDVAYAQAKSLGLLPKPQTSSGTGCLIPLVIGLALIGTSIAAAFF